MEDDRSNMNDFGSPGSNGDDSTSADLEQLRREEFKLVNHCQKLRHWCRDFLTFEMTDGVLSADTVRELQATEPEMPLDEALAAIQLVARGEPLPRGFAGTGKRITSLSAERKRLAVAFFSLFSAVLPDDPLLTDDHFAELAEQHGSVSLEDVLAELEREVEAKS